MTTSRTPTVCQGLLDPGLPDQIADSTTLTSMAANPLPRSTPTAEGVNAAGVQSFLDHVDANPEIELHSLMMLRHGSVIAEGWWHPYDADSLQLVYSVSKSFTATALGFGVAEGLVNLEDPLISYFEEFEADITHPLSRAITLGHLAAMSSGHYEDPLDRAVRADPDEPVRGFLLTPPDAPPGSVFAYNNVATYALAAVIQRRSGESLTDYLRPRLLDPIGIGPVVWDRMGGRDLGFTGLHLRTEDLARFGELYRCDGAWHGVQVLPPGWTELAQQIHITTASEENIDWQQGYGYQFWRSAHGYRADGAFGQFCLILPDQDAVIVTTTATETAQKLLEAAWNHLLPAFGDSSRVDQTHEDGAARLTERLSALALGSPTRPATPELVANVIVNAVSVAPRGGWLLEATEASQLLRVEVGDQAWKRTRIPLDDSSVLTVEARGGWTSPSYFAAELVFSDSPHRMSLTFSAEDGSSTAFWQTVPLFAPTLSSAGLAR